MIPIISRSKGDSSPARKTGLSGEYEVSAILEVPRKAHSLLVLAHGAGAGMKHPAMNTLAEALQAQGIAILRFQFPYMERGYPRPDKPELAVATVAAAVRAAGKSSGGLPVFAGGRSFGGRMTTNAAAQGALPGIRGIVCFGFPLHPAKKPAVSRAAHLVDVPVPMLMLQGTRDDLCDLNLLRPIVAANADRLALHVLDGADHGYHVLKSSGRTDADVLAEVGATVSAWVTRRRLQQN